jgi:hypothetical protein
MIVSLFLHLSHYHVLISVLFHINIICNLSPSTLHRHGDHDHVNTFACVRRTIISIILSLNIMTIHLVTLPLPLYNSPHARQPPLS